MLRDGQRRALSSLTALRVVARITSVLLSMSSLSHPKVLIGRSAILFGLALWLSGLLSGWLLAHNGAPSPTGPTSNSQGAFLRLRMTKRVLSSQPEESTPSGKPPSTNRD